MGRRAIFLDRDGTLIEDAKYLSTVEQVKLLPGAAAAVKAWNDAGWLVILITNQSGVARGYFPESRVSEVNAHLLKLLESEGAKLDAVYYCPHGPADGCGCRKPKPGMILQAAREHDVDLSASVMIGDKADDVLAGEAAGCRGIRCDDLRVLASGFHCPPSTDHWPLLRHEPSEFAIQERPNPSSGQWPVDSRQ